MRHNIMLRTVKIHHSQCMTELLMLCFKQESHSFQTFWNVPQLKTILGTRNTAFYGILLGEDIFSFAMALMKPLAWQMKALPLFEIILYITAYRLQNTQPCVKKTLLMLTNLQLKEPQEVSSVFCHWEKWWCIQHYWQLQYFWKDLTLQSLKRAYCI